MGDTDINFGTTTNVVGDHIPECDTALKPFVGQKFNSIEEGINFYRNYGAASGFDIRRGPVKRFKDGVINWRYVFCSCEGEKNAVDDDDKQKRRRISRRVGCMARLILKFSGRDGYSVAVFLERHTHPLVLDQFKKYLKVNRKLGYVHQNFILNCVRANIGAMTSYRLFKEAVGSYENVGCTGADYKNFARDLRAYIDGSDAQIMLNKMFLRKESCSAFFFAYLVDKDDKLTSIFWADPIARRNYSIFGDVVSFDCTYKTNRYEMIFAPFTGKDNHGKCVTFGAALLSGENHESFEWVFERFIECMGRPPSLIITDQDPAMKIAIKRALPDTRHRLCMWHIMLKVPEKLPTRLKKDESFKKRFNAIVWSDLIEPSVFDKQWNDIMADYGLSDESWFNSMFEIRNYWIPAYFRDHPMSGLCRTTSISESVNSFFNNYLNYGANLVEFMMHFDSAMDAQRNSYDLQNSVDYTTIPKTNTPLKFEKHAATIYTTKQFVKVQEEIEKSCYHCTIVNIEPVDACTLYSVEDGSDHTFTVSINKEDVTAICSCKKFVREGILCCHIFLLFKHFKWVEIPEKYIVSRWTRAAYLRPLDGAGDALLGQIVELDEKKNINNQTISAFYACVGAVEGDKEKANLLLRGITDLKEVLVSGDDQTSSRSSVKSKLFELFYGASKPSEVVVNPPKRVKTKGSGSRIKPRAEKQIRDANKPLRTCKNCGQQGRHDSRNCPFAAEDCQVD